MSAGDFSQQSMRRAIGALKDSTTVGMVKVNSGKKRLQVAIVKATNHDEVLPKEKHMWTIFDSLSAASPRYDVAYCINALHKRLSKTRNWTVALKTLVVIHRALREVDCSFHEELIHGSKGRLMLNLCHFRDESSPHAWDYSAWVRTYSLYLEERLECFSILKYDVQKNQTRMKGLDTNTLLENLPSMQQLLFRLLDCKPEGAVVAHNSLIQYALSIIASESVNVYVAITDGLVQLIDKYFEMERHDALPTLDIYKKAASQGERLSEFFEMCRSLGFGEKHNYLKIEQPPPSFLAAMEEYVAEAPLVLALEWVQINEEEGSTPKTVAAPQAILSINRREEEEEEEEEQQPSDLVTDLLGLDLLTLETSENDQTDAVVSNDYNVESNMNLESAPISWELALVSAPSSNEAPLTSTKLGGGLDMSMLDSLYNNASMSVGMNGNGETKKRQLNPFDSFHDNHNNNYIYEESNLIPTDNNQLMILNPMGSVDEDFLVTEQQPDPSNPFAIADIGEPVVFHDSNPSLI
ncbi:ENTH/ANTH/VHS superfamily protein [Euphorbia peplus]|nr:ENTH/ANTH/VHS superfamily protein [Euphorbia peplus]